MSEKFVPKGKFDKGRFHKPVSRKEKAKQKACYEEALNKCRLNIQQMLRKILKY